MTGDPRVGVVIPTLNEADHIADLLRQLMQSPTDLVAEIVVADGGSTDGTIDIVNGLAEEDHRIQLLSNPARLQSAGINSAVASMDGNVNVIVRIDAHAGYPDDYVARLLHSLSATGADSVVVRLHTIGGNCVQNAIATASNGAIGTGGSAHRMGKQSKYVDHGHHAAFTRTIFERAGGYDPSFRANEDAELDYRIRALGGRIWLDTGIEVRYSPRKTVAALARQYWVYGKGRARNFLKHRERLKMRHKIPPAMAIGLGCSLVGGLFSPFLLLPLITYAALLGTIGLITAVRSHDICNLLLMLVLPAMHLSWGAGFLAGIILSRRSLSIRNADYVAVQNPFD